MTTTKKEHPPILQELFKDSPELLDHPSVTALLEYVKEQHKLTVSQTMKYQTAYFDIIDKCFHSDVFVIGGRECSEVIKDIIRVQRKRVKGGKMPDNTVSVTRPGKYGNPFRLTHDGFIQCYSTNMRILDPWIMWSVTSGFEVSDIVELYEKWIKGHFQPAFGYLPTPPDTKELKGKNLACFCSLDKPCHADVLLEIANS